MTIELRPMGVACNLSCTYCYQEPMREAGNIHTKYDIEKMLAEADRVGQPFNLFGGEALLVPKKDLRTIWIHGMKKFKRNGLQTNGSLIDDEHIEMFKEYNVNVGISIDGPGVLNRLRWAGSEAKTVQMTDLTIRNIKKVVDAGLGLGIIITLHRANASAEHLPALMDFIRYLSSIGVKGGTIHQLEVDKTMPDQEKNVLTQKENILAMTTLANFFEEEENKHLQWRPFSQMRTMLSGDDRKATCYWKNCDFGDTVAVYGIEGDGALSNCGRTNKEGIDWYKADKKSYARYLSLYHTPQNMGGCKGCRFWSYCGGSCPGEAEDSDFRNKTTNCMTQKAMFGFYEKQMEADGEVPVTKSDMLPAIEAFLYDGLASGTPHTVAFAIHTLTTKGQQMLQVPVYKDDAEREAALRGTP
jgi:uncharacterized protein